eukprot:5903599-Prymnesium_polylepis.1
MHDAAPGARGAASSTEQRALVPGGQNVHIYEQGPGSQRWYINDNPLMDIHIDLDPEALERLELRDAAGKRARVVKWLPTKGRSPALFHGCVCDASPGAIYVLGFDLWASEVEACRVE